MYFIPYNLKKTTNLLYTQHLDTKLLNFLQSHAWSHHATQVVCVSSLFIFEVYQTNVCCCCLIEQVKAHVFFFFFHLFLLRGFTATATASVATAATATAAATAAADDVGDQLFNRFGLQEFGKQARPVRFDGDTGALDDRVDLVFGDFLAVIVQDEGRVSASKFSRLYDVL